MLAQAKRWECLNEPFLPPSHRDLQSSSSSTAADSMAKTNKQTQAKQEERGVKLPRGGKDLPTYSRKARYRMQVCGRRSGKALKIRLSLAAKAHARTLDSQEKSYIN